jgi:hypothetical protein
LGLECGVELIEEGPFRAVTQATRIHVTQQALSPSERTQARG